MSSALPENRIEVFFEDALNKMESSRRGEVPLFQVLEAVERAVLGAAIHKHDSCKMVCERLRIPKSSFFNKRKKYFELE